MNKKLYYILLIIMLLIATPAEAQRIRTKGDGRNLHLKTNTLGLGVAVMNMAVEIDLKEHWSIALPIYFSAWNYTKSTTNYKIFTIQPELRYWLREENIGFFSGAHLGVTYYNFVFNKDSKDTNKYRKAPSIGGGLHVGYRIPISKNNRWNLELSVGAGGYKVSYDVYQNTQNENSENLVESIQKAYWGIDQASLSISYLIKVPRRKNSY